MLKQKMRFQLSIVIICKNSVHGIGKAITSIQSLSNDIIVYDSGSTDGTLDILAALPVKLHTGKWEGFGKTREKAVQLARHNWVMILDADEVVSEGLVQELNNLLPNENLAYSFRLNNHLGNRHMKWGAWGNDFRVRLYNKKLIHWNADLVHEKLVIPNTVRIQKLNHAVHHCTAQSISDLEMKMDAYAALTAKQYFLKGKKLSWLRKQAGPGFAFLKTYLFKFGFLDGRDGLQLARILANYTALKYRQLDELWNRQEKKKHVIHTEKPGLVTLGNRKKEVNVPG